MFRDAEPASARRCSRTLYSACGYAYGSWFALFPVASSSLLLLFSGDLQPAHRSRLSAPAGSCHYARPAAGLPPADLLIAALRRYGQVLDRRVVRDLAELLHSRTKPRRRISGDWRLKCADIMTPSVVTADYAMPLEEAWLCCVSDASRRCRVVDRSNRLIGMRALPAIS